MEMEPTTPGKMRVLIIGAGPAGILMAQVLKKVGILATVFEQDASSTARPRDWNFGIYWAQSRLEECLPSEITARLPEVQTDGAYKLNEGAVLPIFNGTTGEMLQPIQAPFAMRYRRRAWLDLIGEGVDIRFGKGLASISTTATGVIATFTDGTRESGNLMIGADGAHSVVRRFLFESSPQDGELLESPVVTSMTCAKFDRDVSLATRNLSPLAHITLNPNGLFTFASTHDVSAPDPADWIFNVIWSWRSDKGPDGDTADALKDDEQIHNDLIARSQNLKYPFKQTVSTIEPGSAKFWHARMTYWPTKPWDSRGGLVTLAGDAAHAMTFHRGQGLGNAIADAAELLQCLRGMAAHTPSELAKAVQEYEKGVCPRGYEAVMGNLENTLAIHDWETVMKSPIVVSGLKKEGDKVRVGDS